MDKILARLMHDNIKQVWSERDAQQRLTAIENIYAKDSALFHVGHHVKGYEAINNSVTGTLANMPGEFIFTILKPIIINYNIGRLIWGVGAEGQPSVATGMDVALFENGKIKSLYVFLD